MAVNRDEIFQQYFPQQFRTCKIITRGNRNFTSTIEQCRAKKKKKKIRCFQIGLVFGRFDGIVSSYFDVLIKGMRLPGTE